MVRTNGDRGPLRQAPRQISADRKPPRRAARRHILAAYLTAAIVAGLSGAAVGRFVLPPRPAGAAPATSRTSTAPSPTPPVADDLQVLAQPPPGPLTLRAPADPATVPAPKASFFGWAFLDRRTGQVTGSANRDTGTNTTESMIKVWIAAYYLRTHDDASEAAQTELTRMIIDSDDNVAIKYYALNGGDASIGDLTARCGLHHTSSSGRDEWSYTNMPPADAVALGLCVANGTAAGPKWTAWLLDAMRKVRGGVGDQQRTYGGGRWGIIDALPSDVAGQTSIKNGWTAQTYDHNWHINCLAIHADWILAVSLRYPWTGPVWYQATNLQPGADACAAVARALLTQSY